MWEVLHVLLLGVAPRVLVPKTNGLSFYPLKVKGLGSLTPGQKISSFLCSDPLRSLRRVELLSLGSHSNVLLNYSDM